MLEKDYAWEMQDKFEQPYLHVRWSLTELSATHWILCAAEDLLEMLAKAAATLGWVGPRS